MTDLAPGGLFATPAPRGRSRVGVATSVWLHGVALGLLVAVAQLGPAPALPREHRPLTFVMMVPPSIPLELTRSLTLPAVVAAREAGMPAPPIPAATPKPEPPPPAPRPLARSEPSPAPPEPVRPEPPALAPPPALPKAPPPVTVGLFANAAAAVHETEPASAVRVAGFDAPAPISSSSESKLAAAVGGFDRVPGAPPARVARPVGVASAGFGDGRTDRGVTVTPVADVRSAGFDAVRPAAQAPPRAAPPPARVDVPVEIVSKPAPVYTAEARALKLEGDVVLDVEFGATGTVSVLQVVRGLGHGLDEAASRAAAQIRFKPAQSGGRPISVRTTVHIAFRLA